MHRIEEKVNGTEIISSEKRSIRPYSKCILGCMGSGKSEELINEANTLALMGYKCAVLRFDIDTRYSDKEVVITHRNQQLSKDSHPNISVHVIPVEALQDYLESKDTNTARAMNAIISERDAIFLDEGQFAQGEDILTRFAEDIVLEIGRIFMVAGLASWRDLTPVTNMLEFTRHADVVVYKQGVCFVCKFKSAIYSVLIYDWNRGSIAVNPLKVSVGGGEKYMSVCNFCLHRCLKGEFLNK
jgi:thymidine kinase